MENVERVFAVLGLIWVIDILFARIFPGTWLTWYTYCENLAINLGGSFHGSRESVIWALAFFVVPAGLIVFGFFAVQSVIARFIKKARA
jgi:hypothetical protein